VRELVLGLGLALAGILSGMAWKIPGMLRADQALFMVFNQGSWARWLDDSVLVARLWGTKWVFLGALAGALLWRPTVGWSLGLTALLALGLERAVKASVKRPRPFVRSEATILRQPRSPEDFSYPSGDATRAWFLFAAMAYGYPLPGALAALLALLALSVSVGRVRLGVHYPMDVWGGSSLGAGFGLAWCGLAQLLA
jgi:undecaprenyl-diphosphatase